MPDLNDESQMPYGKHKGRLLGNIPAKDLLWLYDNEKAFQGVREYIEANLDVLKKEAYPKNK